MCEHLYCRRMNSCRRDPERPLFRDSAGGMILDKLVWEINGNGNKMQWLVGDDRPSAKEMGAPGFRQVRAARRRNTLLLCVCAISFLEGNSSRMYLVTGESRLQRA